MITTFSYSLSTILGVLNCDPTLQLNGRGKVQTISTSSLECQMGTLFVPLKDIRDGHNFIPDALNRGASFFLCENKHPILKTLSIEDQKKAILVEDTLLALGELAKFHRNAFRPIVIAITGSSGKTSTKDLIGNLFSFLPNNQIVITEKNYNNQIGVPFTLFRISEFTKVVICEMGMNQRGEIEYLSKIASPNFAIITNIGSAHIENLKSPKNIALEKSDILIGMQKSGVLFLPDTTDFLSLVKRRATKLKIKVKVWSNTDKSNLKIISENANGFKLKYEDQVLNWLIPGRTLLTNVRGMINLGEHLGLHQKNIVKAIQTFKAPDKRLNIKAEYFKVIDDTYNANPESMLSSIQASTQVAGDKPLIWILGSMKELGKFSKQYHIKIGKQLTSYKKTSLITFGKDAKYFSLPLKSNAIKTLPDDFLDFDSLAKDLKNLYPKDTVILVKGSRSMKMERIVESLLRIKA
ncbi:MAG: UDP-N-acetylmuramoyl-tripeptide--D-alanyl-D-alanine ligase [Leptospira sp.]|nr:UDP-N-acetylmuramoyl-tripeptide--D-alanyl-D-alanine ligase [Leptospira sp.]